MGKRAAGGTGSRVAQEAARIMCEDGLADYRLAKQKAVERLGLGIGTPLPSNADIQAAVMQYQRLFGGESHARRVQSLRETALRAMRLLATFQPHLVGAVATGAATDGHHVQLHCFADQSERVDVLLQSRGIPYEVSGRRYRYSGGSSFEHPVLSFQAQDTGISVAVFPEAELRQPPLSPVDGAPVKRFDLAAVEAMAGQPPDVRPGR